MRWKLLAVVLLVAGCGEDEVPFDDLPLRDALRADPEVIASLSQAARLRLGARLEAARVGDDATDGVGDSSRPAASLVLALDRARELRRADPLMVGAIDRDGQARSFREATAPDEAGLLAPVGDPRPTTVTATLEARALAGKAGAALNALVGAFGAHNLRRVVGWPIGALAVGDTVYVNASWLVALAEGGGSADAGVDAAPRAPDPTPSTGARAAIPSAAPAPTVARWQATLSPAAQDQPQVADGVQTASLTAADGGVDATPFPQPPPPPPRRPDDDCATACNGCATTCASDGTYDSGDSCSSDDDDACSDTGEDDGDACSDTGDQGGDECSDTGDEGDACADTGEGGAQDCGSAGEGDAECQVGHRRRSRGPTSHGSLLAPLGYLLLRRRR